MTALVDIGKRLGTLNATVCSIVTLIMTAAILGRRLDFLVDKA